ncbi:serine/Arginine-related protein 53 [Lontra canadensis]|uniref:serine/Arginine-related protein 53 n=1 Tax=Lontra canadensis TaxID=76717 RepID=UPI0013F38AA9|nr:serine/Arginine-related protein 53 [Lontra canadensis]
MGTDASLPERACSMLRSLTILPAESSDLIAMLRLKSHYLYFAKAAPCSERGFCVGVTIQLNTGELDLLRRGVAKRKLTSARLRESVGYPDWAFRPHNLAPRQVSIDALGSSAEAAWRWNQEGGELKLNQVRRIAAAPRFEGRFFGLWRLQVNRRREAKGRDPEMGRRSSDTEEESRSKRKKKHRRRSSSSSSSDSRTYSRKKGGRKSRSKSRSWSRDLQPRSHSYDRRRRHRSSSSSSYGSRRKRSRSRSRGRGKSYRVQRSRSKSRTRRESGNIKAGLEHLPPAEQAKARLQLVLEAADQATLVEQVKRVKEIEAIESDSFVQQTFRSSKEVKKSVEPGEVKHTAVTSGPAPGAADPPSSEKEIDPSSIPTAIKYQDDNSLAHPNLFIEKADAEEKWFKRLIALRQERLMGSPVA